MIISEASDIPFNIVAKGDLDLDELQSDIPEKASQQTPPGPIGVYTCS